MIADKRDEYLAHYGILRRSGRYPWGSHNNVPQRSRSFLQTIDDLKRQGLSDTQIAESFSTKAHPFNTSTLRALKTIAIAERKQDDIRQAQRLKDRGWSNVKIGERMGLNESSVRSLLAPGAKDKATILGATSDMLRSQVDKKGAIDIGTRVELSLPLSENTAQLVGISKQKFNTAVAMLQEEGYKVHYVKVPTAAGNRTTTKVLAKPEVKWVDMVRDPSLIKTITDHSSDGGRTFDPLPPLKSASSRRLQINYAEDGGSAADGVVFLRRGAKNLDLGVSQYAQVRIPIDGTHYIKGMAVYKDDLPPGIDMVFNTNKSRTGSKLDALKEMDRTPAGNIDEDNPFGAQIKPGGRRGAVNIVNEEGDWDKWSRALSSQMLSKQSPNLAKQQLNVTYERRRLELDAIEKLTNPAVKKKLLDTFANETDSASVHLKAAALPKSAQRVLLPISSIKPTEIYAPSYRNGERVVLVRHPHGGPFEIPELTVNNRNPEARKLIGTRFSVDAVGIHSKVAEQLSGADFDGDHVLVIPNNSRSVKTAPALSGLKDFDPRASFAPYDGMKTIDGGTYNATTKKVEYGPSGPSGSTKHQEMGKITNLIADMSIRNASNEELAQALRHSMVVIDAEKHNLDYRASARVNGITNLKKKYQIKETPEGPKFGGASTLITRAKSELRINERKPRLATDGGPIDKKTGEKVFVDTGRTYVDFKTGETKRSQQTITQLGNTRDAHSLSSGTPIEKLYADHSNRLKSLANEARKAMVSTPKVNYSPSAKTAYAKEVASLNSKLNTALKNAPLERQAQAISKSIVDTKKRDNPGLEGDDLKKVRNQALATARLRVGAKKQDVEITKDEWNAIQAGAISNAKLTDVLNNADIDNVRKLATPRENTVMTSAKQARATAMLASGFTQAEVADQLGIALSTLKSSIGRGEE